MDKDLLKGLLFLLIAIAVILGLVVFGSDTGPDKAQCIADALKAKVPLARIDDLCKLTETRPTH
ncbi:MAG: hypothetical protein V4582_17965 [Pseudomonadota bacterium]